MSSKNILLPQPKHHLNLILSPVFLFFLLLCFNNSHGNGSPQNGIHTMSYNPAENAILLTSPTDGGTYELYFLPQKSGEGSDSNTESMNGKGL